MQPSKVRSSRASHSASSSSGAGGDCVTVCGGGACCSYWSGRGLSAVAALAVVGKREPAVSVISEGPPTSPPFFFLLPNESSFFILNQSRLTLLSLVSKRGVAAEQLPARGTGFLPDPDELRFQKYFLPTGKIWAVVVCESIKDLKDLNTFSAVLSTEGRVFGLWWAQLKPKGPKLIRSLSRNTTSRTKTGFSSTRASAQDS